MGLQGSINDCSSESFLIITITLFATAIRYIRSLSVTIFCYKGVKSHDHVQDELMDRLGSGLASLAILAEQLNLNRISSYKYGDHDESASSKCVVCLSKMKEGAQVCRLKCFHVFHKGCLDGWLGQLNFSCPVCRLKLVEERLVEMQWGPLGSDIFNFFSF